MLEFEHINSWKNREVFQKQLELNMNELAGPYPSHWNAFLSFMTMLTEQRKWMSDLKIKLLDVGCGCGAVSGLCTKHIPNLAYTGIDYALEAIETAQHAWPKTSFLQMDYKTLTREFILDYDIILASSLTNVMPNGDECMKFMLSLEPRNMILLKMLMTDMSSSYRDYTVYSGLIKTYEFRHNREGLLNMFKEAGYDFKEIRESDVSHFLLTRI